MYNGDDESLIIFSATIGMSAKFVEVAQNWFELSPSAEVTVHCSYEPMISLTTRKTKFWNQNLQEEVDEEVPKNETEPSDETRPVIEYAGYCAGTCGRGSMVIEDTMDITLNVENQTEDNIDAEEPIVKVGSLLPIDIEWHDKPSGLGGLIDFYIHTVGIIIQDQRVNIVENNCFATAFHAKLVGQSHINPKVCSFAYKAFNVANIGIADFRTDVDVEIRLCISTESEPDLSKSCPSFTRRDEDCPNIPELGYTWKG